MKLPKECPFGEGSDPIYVRIAHDIPSKYGGYILTRGAITVVFRYDARSMPTPGFVCAYTPESLCEWSSISVASYETLTPEQAILALLEQDGILTVVAQ